MDHTSPNLREISREIGEVSISLADRFDELLPIELSEDDWRYYALKDLAKGMRKLVIGNMSFVRDGKIDFIQYYYPNAIQAFRSTLDDFSQEFSTLVEKIFRIIDMALRGDYSLVELDGIRADKVYEFEEVRKARGSLEGFFIDSKFDYESLLRASKDCESIGRYFLQNSDAELLLGYECRIYIDNLILVMKTIDTVQKNLSTSLNHKEKYCEMLDAIRSDLERLSKLVQDKMLDKANRREV